MGASGSVWIKPRKAADLLECTVRTVWEYVRKGKLDARHRLGRGRGKPVEVSLESVQRLKNKFERSAITGAK